jgi:hypothetical protein
MRWTQLLYGLLAIVWLGFNVKKMKFGMDPNRYLDVFFINLAITCICFFMNPDITMFNTLILNGKVNVLDAYKQSISNSPNYFPASDLFFFFYCVSFMLSVGAISIHYWIERMTKSTSTSSTSSTVDSNSLLQSPSSPSSPSQSNTILNLKNIK